MKLIVATSLLALAALPAQALYKVVAPDGKVTYTDRPPQAAEGRAVPIGRSGTSGDEVALPIVLREAMSRFPVVLYTTADCQPCDAGRALLKQRGVPFRERTAGSTPADNEAWRRITGTLDSPSLTIGSQVLRGFSPDAWNSYLDTAGYPRESRLPANYVLPRPVPLVDSAPRETAVPRPAAAPAREPEAPQDGGFRF